VATVEVDGPGAIVVVRPHGDIDIGEQPLWQEALGLACADATRLVVLDCAGIDFIDSTALGELVRANQQMTAKGGGLQLVRVPANMERVLRMVKLWEPLGARRDEEVLDPLVEAALHRTDEDAPRTLLG
jgi:anti-anti-sigma factor